jgi:HSP20 family protein
MALPVRRFPGVVVSRTNWDPFREFDEVYRQLGRVVGAPQARVGQDGEQPRWTPPADVSETDEAYVVELDVPGVAHDDVSAEVDEGRLTVKGELKDKEQEGTVHRRTRRTGQFVYRATLPKDVDAGDITAALTNGVLTVRVPKAEKAQPRRIEITVA